MKTGCMETKTKQASLNFGTVFLTANAMSILPESSTAVDGWFAFPLCQVSVGQHLYQCNIP